MTHDEIPRSDATPDIVARWAITMTEPLIATQRRIELDDAMRMVCMTHPEWATNFFGGVIANLIRSLENGDPFRHLAARLACREGEDLVRGAAELTPETTGAVAPSGSPFGTHDDCVDLTGPVHGLLDQDPALAAVETPLSTISAAVLAICADGWQAGRDALDAVHANNPRNFDSVYIVAAPALRWAAHRRRASGASTEDDWVIRSINLWAARAELATNGDPWDHTQVEIGIAAARIHTADAIER